MRPQTNEKYIPGKRLHNYNKIPHKIHPTRLQKLDPDYVPGKTFQTWRERHSGEIDLSEIEKIERLAMQSTIHVLPIVQAPRTEDAIPLADIQAGKPPTTGSIKLADIPVEAVEPEPVAPPVAPVISPLPVDAMGKPYLQLTCPGVSTADLIRMAVCQFYRVMHTYPSIIKLRLDRYIGYIKDKQYYRIDDVSILCEVGWDDCDVCVKRY